MLRPVIAACLAALLAPQAWAGADSALPSYHAERRISAAISSIGDAAMAPLMDAWLSALRQQQPGLRRGRWEHRAGDAGAGALMFELADMAPVTRPFGPAETAPYAHQFAGDMMKAPLLVRVAGGAHPAYIGVNKRPGSPLPVQVRAFLEFALSREGQQIVADQGQFEPLNAADADAERARLQGYLATLDPALPHYQRGAPVSGAIRSVGSDGMKSLLERWMRDFEHQQPGVRKGEHWEHLGTLNGFHALMAGETDLAPMGRELWPSERAAYAAVRNQGAPLEIRVARGGFNTPQRTTAQAIFVHPSNPIGQITMQQLAAALGGTRPLTHWGQLGLTGEWSQRPITVYMPPPAAPNAMSMQIMALHGDGWRSDVHAGSIAETAAAIAADPGAIGFGGLEEGAPGLKTLAVGARADGTFYEANYDNASSGRYPLTRYMYIRLNREPGKPLAPQVREFLRYILSSEGQEPILYSGYFPLTAEEARQELAKLQ